MTNKILSVFIDESGDFGPYDSHAPYYLVLWYYTTNPFPFPKILQILTDI